MGTRSTITVKCQDQVIRSIYCHWDGYLGSNGIILQKHYNSQELAEKLIAPGDMSSLGPECDGAEGHSYRRPSEGQTIYYGRDRGEDGTEAKTVSGFAQVCKEEYDYYWDGDQWLVHSCHGIELSPLLENLIKQGLIKPEEVTVDTITTIDDPVQEFISNPIMKFFDYAHLPEHLQEVSKPFHDVAKFMNESIKDSAEKSAGLRKLLEAKDCFVRARLEK